MMYEFHLRSNVLQSISKNRALESLTAEDDELGNEELHECVEAMRCGKTPGPVFMSVGITYDGHISKSGITELKVGSSENWYSRVR